MSAIPLGATPQDTAEFMLGRVAVVPVLFESNGAISTNTQNWTPQEIDAAIAKVRTGVQWWSDALDALGTVHELEFVIDESFARTPFPTPYEPIDLPSQDAPLYISPFIDAQGIKQATSLEDAVRQFNHAARLRLQTDWAFTIFMIDSSDDLDGQFPAGSDFRTAHAFPGGLYIVSPSTRPASTITHEMGHIFWARDEYPGGGSWTDRRGYYNAQNVNAANNPTSGFVQENSIMSSGALLAASYFLYELPASTRAMIGWLDSDGDGIFDVADVPLELTGNGRYDADRGVFTFDGNSRAVPLPNRNSWGTQSDITLNRVDRIEYRVDEGAWQTALMVDKQVSEINFELSISPFETIEVRAIDDSVGVTSPILRALGATPFVSDAAVGGFAFLDSDGNGRMNASEPMLSGVIATLTKADRSILFAGVVEPDNYSNVPLNSILEGVTLAAVGAAIDGRISSIVSPASTGVRAFRYLDSLAGAWQSRWTSQNYFLASFSENTGVVALDAIGASELGSYGRLEAYDSSGNLIARSTTTRLSVGESATMRVVDRDGRIASVRAFGHNATAVGLDFLRFGTPSEVVTGEDGLFRFDVLADGDYLLTTNALRTIHRHTAGPIAIRIVDGVSSASIAGFERVTSPWQNPNDAFDVDGNGVLEPLDALRIINDLARNGTRIFSISEPLTSYLDTNDDGSVTALDALQVINEIARRSVALRVLAEQESRDSVFALWDPEIDKKFTP